MITVVDQNDHAPRFFGYQGLEKVTRDLGFVEVVRGQVLPVYELEIGPDVKVRE